MTGGVDLNGSGLPALLFGSVIPGEADVYGQNPVRPADGFSAMDELWADRAAIWWRPPCQVIALRRAFPGMAFAQLTYRESLGDIEACLSAQAAKFYHLGFREPI